MQSSACARNENNNLAKTIYVKRMINYVLLYALIIYYVTLMIENKSRYIHNM